MIRTGRRMLIGGAAILLLLPAAWQVVADRTPFERFGREVASSVSAAGGPMARNERLRRALAGLGDDLSASHGVAPAYRAGVQAGLVRLRQGNGAVAVGEGGQLLLMDDIRYATGPGFLHPGTLVARRRGVGPGAAADQPDPRPAILALQAEADRRGILLVVMPVPGKAQTAPRALTGPGGPEGPVNNPSHDALVETLRAAGVRVFDPTATLTDLARRGEPPFLDADTHWSPAGVEAASRGLAAFIQQEAPRGLRFRRPVTYRTKPATRSDIGLLARLLGFDEGMASTPRQTVRVRQVLGPDGRPPAPVGDGRVVLVGDSYANIYSEPGLGWGAGAGLAEQLAFELGEPVTRIGVNDGGAFENRLALAQEMGRRPLWPSTVRVVILQFAAAELAFGDWLIIPLAIRPAGGRS